MIPIININNDVEEHTRRPQNCNTKSNTCIGGYVKVRDSSYTGIFICVDTILNHINTKAI